MSRKKIKRTDQAQAAHDWRVRLNLTQGELADRTGYSREAVYQYERGFRHDGARLSDFAWQRYQMACAAVEHEIRTGRTFAW
jgi:DNA-binding XRE family transcriptional regulator